MDKELQDLLETCENPAIKKAYEDGFIKGFKEGLKEIEDKRKDYTVKEEK